jgi:hypothetical protein
LTQYAYPLEKNITKRPQLIKADGNTLTIGDLRKSNKRLLIFVDDEYLSQSPKLDFTACSKYWYAENAFGDKSIKTYDMRSGRADPKKADFFLMNRFYDLTITDNNWTALIGFFKDVIGGAKAVFEATKATFEGIEKTFETTKKAFDAAKKGLEGVGEGIKTFFETGDAEKAHKKAKKKYDEAQKKFDKVEDEYKKVKEKFEDVKKKYNEAKKEYEKYEKQEKNYSKINDGDVIEQRRAEFAKRVGKLPTWVMTDFSQKGSYTDKFKEFYKALSKPFRLF